MSQNYFYPPSSGGGSSSNASVGLNGAAAPTSSTEIGAIFGGLLTPLQADASGNLKVAISSGLANPLPVTDAAAEASLASIDTKLTSQATAANQTSGAQKSQIVDGGGNVWGPRTGSGGVNYMPVLNLEAASSGSAVALRTLQVGGSDGTNLRTLSVDAAGVLNVNATFPGSISVTQGTSPWVVSGTVTTGGLTDTQLRASAVAISAASLPLPTGASTSALQTSGNSSLSSIDGKLNSLGQKTMANSVPVVIASDQSAITVTTNGLTDTQLRASPVPVSGPLTDTQLRATPVPVTSTSAPPFYMSTVVVTVAASVATIILPINLTRYSSNIQNNTGADLWLGNATVTNTGGTKGIRIPADAIFNYEAQAALYGFSVAGGETVTLEESN